MAAEVTGVTPERPGVVVGVDGSNASLAALAYGAWEADRRGVPLYLVHCYDLPGPAFTALGLGPDVAQAQESAAAAGRGLDELAERARAAYPRLPVHTTVVAGHPGASMVQASASAELVVVGSRGLGGFAGLMLGSVGTQLAAHSKGPVIVIRPPESGPDRYELGAPPPDRPVVVGVDGAPDSDAAIAFAFDEAAGRGVPVVVLYAWWMLPVSRLRPEGTHPYALATEADLAQAEEEARRLLAEATAGAREQHPDVVVTLLPARALNPVQALLEASTDAGLLVVSRHGGNALTRLLFSSVGDVAVRHAPCPVAVVPETSTRDGRGDGAATGRRARRGRAATGPRTR